jgi:undecaprenyl-diphosphatase
VDVSPSPLLLVVESISLFQAIVIGIVQGLTEFLPISSTAHIKMVPLALGWGDPGSTFTAVIQLGSVVAIISYFWADLKSLLSGMGQAIAERNFHAPDFRLGLGILIGTIPIVMFGLLIKFVFREAYETSARSSLVIAIAAIGMALLLGFAELIGSRKRGYESLDVKDGISMGLGQSLALIPGVSRSGATLTTGLFMGLQRETAARFSFLLGIPAIIISGLAEINELLEPQSPVGIVPVIGGVLAAVVSSYLAIYWLLRFLKNHSTWIFVFYRIGFGVAILAAIAAGRLSTI